MQQPVQVTPVMAGSTPAPLVVQYQTPVRNTSPRIYESLACKQMRVLGFLQIVCGLLAIIFNVVAIIVNAGVAVAGHGFWCGVFFIIAGGFATGAAKHKTSCMIVTCMVMSIIAACMTVPLLSLAAAGLGVDNYNYCPYYYYSYTYSSYYNSNCTKNKAGLAMNSILLIIAVVEAVASIWQSALCCAAVCCCAPRQAQPLATVTTVQYVYSPTGWQPNTGVPNAPVTYVLPPGSQMQYVQQPHQFQTSDMVVPPYPSTTPSYAPTALTHGLPNYSGASASAPPPYASMENNAKVAM